MKKFTSFPSRYFFGFVAFMLLLGVISCSPEPQRLLFSNHPVSYQKTEKQPAIAIPAEIASLTASAAEPSTVVLPVNPYAANEAKATASAAERALVTNIANPSENGKVNRKEKMAVAKTAWKKIKAAQKENKKLSQADKKSIQANGLVSNKTALIVILVGLVLLLFNAGVGAAVVLVGGILLLLNYI